MTVTNFTEDNEVGLFMENMPAQNNSENTASDDCDDVLSHSIDAQHQFITFTIGTEEYGTPILTVQEIRGWIKTTPLPNTPVFVKGVTNLRGNIVPIFDLRARFSGQLTEITERHVVIMVEVNKRTIGLLVDAISDILTIDENQIQPPPLDNLVIDIQYLDGLVATDNRMVALLNIEKLFDNELIDQLHNTNKIAS